jgi:hypothetical protein
LSNATIHSAGEPVIDFQLLVPSVVVVEAWGMLVGSRKVRQGGEALLAWLNTPGTALVLPRHEEPLFGVAELTSRVSRLDCVDAMIAELADDITRQCTLNPPLHVGTFDTTDYLRIKAFRDLQLTIYDAASLEEV